MGRSFNKDFWLIEAEARRKRYIEAGKLRVAARVYERDLKGIAKLAVLVPWIEAKGFTVDFTGTDLGEVNSANKHIRITAVRNPLAQAYILMHEIGHILVQNRYKGPGERFAKGYPQGHKKSASHTRVHRMDVLDEEFEAWSQGWRQAKRLNIVQKSDRRSFDKIRCECLWAHTNHAVRPL